MKFRLNYGVEPWRSKYHKRHNIQCEGTWLDFIIDASNYQEASKIAEEFLEKKQEKFDGIIRFGILEEVNG